MTENIRIGIITRLDNTNAGNEALSTELIRLAAEMVPTARVMAVDRYPRYFEHLKIASLEKKSCSLLASFDGLARHLAAKLFRPDIPLPAIANDETVRLHLTARELAPAVRKLKNIIGVRRNLARFGLIERDEALRTVSMCGRVNLLIWNPAGEFHPTGNRDQTFRLLLLMRMAQQMNVATAIVNHSLELSDDLLREVVGHVYRNADHICVRDARSVEVVRSLGVASGNISESPDLAFLAARRSAMPPLRLDEIPDGAIGLAINAAEAVRGVDEWQPLLAKLQELGRPIAFVSNAMNGDLAFGTELMAKCGGTIIVRQPTYIELRELYRRMSVVVSSRLHAAILALCADTPVITLEPSVFKLSAIFQQLRYPIPTDRITLPGWSDRVAENVEVALAERAQFVSFGRQAMARQTDDIFRSYRLIFGLVSVKRVAIQAPSSVLN
jgi:polysaccharide pyruvyl transferase WcaK-like protein